MKRIEFEGSVHEFPDDFSDDEISNALSGGASAQPQGHGASGSWEAPEPEQGYLKQVGNRLVDQVKGMYEAWKSGDLEAMTGLKGLQEQYNPDRIRKATDNFQNPAGVLLESIPFIGPSLGGINSNLAEGKYKTAAAMATTDILPLLATKRAVSSLPKLVPELERSAAKNYMRILEPTSDIAVTEAERLAPKLAESKITAPSRRSLQNDVEMMKAKVGPQTSTAFEKGPALQWDILNKKLEGVRERHIYIKGTNKITSGRMPLSQYLDDIQNDLFDLADEQGNVPQQILDNFIDDLNQGLVNSKGDYAANLSHKSKGKITKSAARAIREYLDTENPSGAAVNGIYSMYAKFGQFLEKSRKDRIKSEASIQKGASKGFGALVQKYVPRPVRTIPAAIASTFESVPWNTVSGATKQRIAEALANNDFKQVSNLLATAQASKTNPLNQRNANDSRD